MKRFLCVVMAMLLFCACALAEEKAVPGAEDVALGQQYENGDGVEQDYAKAMEYYLSAAEAGNGEGMRRVGRLYQYGNGAETDYALAMEWYVREPKRAMLDPSEISAISMKTVLVWSRIMPSPWNGISELPKRANPKP